MTQKMSREAMDKIVNDHFMYEATANLEGVLGTYTDDPEHHVHGGPDGLLRGKAAIRGSMRASSSARWSTGATSGSTARAARRACACCTCSSCATAGSRRSTSGSTTTRCSASFGSSREERRRLRS